MNLIVSAIGQGLLWGILGLGPKEHHLLSQL